MESLHVLRPAWLLLIPAALLLNLLWRTRRNITRRLSAHIAPHLLQHLLLDRGQGSRPDPALLLTLFLCLGALLAAGPTWQLQAGRQASDHALLILAVELAPSMDTGDQQPSRLEAVKRKLHDLVQSRQGAPTALIVYSASAHLVLPPTGDAALLETYIQALSTSLLETPGNHLRAVQRLALTLSEKANSPSSVVVFADGASPGEFDELARHASDTLQWLLVACAGQGGGALDDLARTLDAGRVELSPDDSDIQWINDQVSRYFQANHDPSAASQAAGYWLCWALAPLVLLSLRRGWRVDWLGAVLLAIGMLLPGSPARATPLLDAFASADQQGRWAFEHGRYPLASQRFAAPYWKGLAAYHAADYRGALAQFARVDTAEGYFYRGNCQARQYQLVDAIAAYRRALALRPDFPQARANLALVLALEKEREDAARNAPEQRSDAETVDNSAGKGRSTSRPPGQMQADERWLDSLRTSPALFLRNKFRLQDSRAAKESSR